MTYASTANTVTRHQFAWVLATLLSAWLIATPTTSANAADADAPIVTILGDSLTAGFGVAKTQAYPALLETTLRNANQPVQIVNAGVSGNTTAGGLRRVAWMMRTKPDVMVIALGGNDGLRGIDPAASKANLAAIIDAARKRHPTIKILLTGMQSPPNMGKAYTTAFEAIFAEVAKEKEVALLPFLLEGVAGHEQFNLPDGIHPNPDGHQKIADLVQPHLLRLLNPEPVAKAPTDPSGDQ